MAARRQPQPRHRQAYRVQQLKAFQLYAAGEQQAAIATHLGVSRNAISVWRRKDRWDERIDKLTDQSVQAADFASGNVRANALIELDKQIPTRVAQLRALCDDLTVTPGTRLAAIRAWFDLSDRFRNSEADRSLAQPIPAGITITGVPLHVVKPAEDTASP